MPEPAYILIGKRVRAYLSARHKVADCWDTGEIFNVHPEEQKPFEIIRRDGRSARYEIVELVEDNYTMPNPTTSYEEPCEVGTPETPVAAHTLSAQFEYLTSAVDAVHIEINELMVKLRPVLNDTAMEHAVDEATDIGKRQDEEYEQMPRMTDMAERVRRLACTLEIHAHRIKSINKTVDMA